MLLDEFRLERFFAKHEFSAPYLMCCSDCESLTVQELLDLEGDDGRASLVGLRLGYTESRGDPELRQRISDTYHGLGAEEVLVTAGAEEAIFIFMNSMLVPGDHIIVQHPCYQSLAEVARSIGCTGTSSTGSGQRPALSPFPACGQAAAWMTSAPGWSQKISRTLIPAAPTGRLSWPIS